MKKKRSKNYRKIWETYNKACLLPGIHIHHIDGDCENDSPENLLACTPEEHWQIHYDQGDAVALNGKFIQFAAKFGVDNGMYGKSRKGEFVGAKNGMYKKGHLVEGKRNGQYTHGKKCRNHKFKCAKCGNNVSVGYSKVCNRCKNQRGDNPRAKKIVCIKTNKIWDCIKDASEELNINHSTLRGWLNPKRTKNPNKSTLRYYNE